MLSLVSSAVKRSTQLSVARGQSAQRSAASQRSYCSASTGGFGNSKFGPRKGAVLLALVAGGAAAFWYEKRHHKKELNKEAQESNKRLQEKDQLIQDFQTKLNEAETALQAERQKHQDEKIAEDEARQKHREERIARHKARKEARQKRKEEKRASKKAEEEKKEAEVATANASESVVEPVVEPEIQEQPRGDDEEEEAPVFPSKYVIVGGGPAAFNAMKEILHVEPDAQILIVSEESHTPYDRSPLSKEMFWQKDFEATEALKYPNWRGDLFDLEYHSADFYTDPKQNITFMPGRKVTDLDAGRHLITLDDGAQFKYEKCLLAVGTTPNTLDVAIPSGAPVSQVKTAEDFLSLHRRTLDPEVKHITVIGNDYLSADLVDALVIRSRISGSNAKVAQVFPDQGILASVFPTYFAEYLTEKTRATGVDVNPSVRINSIVETPNKDHKLRITLDNDKVIDTDHLVLSLGGVPNVDLARKAYLEVDQIAGGIAVNAELQARSDLYVAGDVASFYDGHLGRRRVEGIDHAEISGKVAGLNMTGKNKAYTYQPIRWGAVSQNVSYQGVGLIDARLDMVGVWQKGPSAPLIPSGPDGDFIPDPEVPLSTVYEDANKYERGVVYYLDGPKVVGVMMINVNGQMDVAKRLVTFPRQFDDLSRLRTQIYLGNKPKNEDEETGAAPL